MAKSGKKKEKKIGGQKRKGVSKREEVGWKEGRVR